MALLFLFIFIFQNTLIPANTACEPPFIDNHLGQKNSTSLELIKATVDGRIRFNKVILDMLKNEDTPVEERVLEFFENQGFSEKFIIEKYGSILDEVLEASIKNTIDEIQTLTTTQILCSFIVTTNVLKKHL